MRAKPTHSLYQYALVACIGITLLLGQTFKLHMHVQRDANSTTSTPTQILDVHIASSLHDTMPDSVHDGSDTKHHVSEVDISPDSLAKKIELLGLYVFLFVVIGILLQKQQVSRIARPARAEAGPSTSHYLLHPPLRAPPR